MELVNDFTVSLPPAEAFAVLTDVARIAPCLPGAELQETRGEEYLGVVKVKVGPISAQYKGAARFLELDPETHHVVLRAEGRDTRGQGSANATITATLAPDHGGTHVEVRTDLNVSGKVAQFGRGVLAEVSGKLLTQFVDCLEATIAAASPTTGSAPPGSAARAGTATDAGHGAPAAAAEPVDLLGLAGSAVLKRLPLAGAGAAVLALLTAVVVWWRRRTSRTRS